MNNKENVILKKCDYRISI